MIIAGINGVGKSSLLYALMTRQGTVTANGKVMYISPHRIWVRQNIQARFLLDTRRTFEDAVASNSLSGVAGLSITSSNRSPDSADEATKFIKFSLSQIETQRQNALTKLVDNDATHEKLQELKKIYEPLKEMTRVLLPHLEFYKISMDDPNNVKCLWKRAEGLDPSVGSTTTVDIDDLSSGEKSILTLFMGFIEYQINNRIRKIMEDAFDINAKRGQDLIVLIDEPELHLHPILEERVLQYLRKLISEDNVQFVITTHSITLLNNATVEELFLLSPRTNPPRNQLAQLTDAESRLHAIRMLCGNTYPLTASRNIMCVEGEMPEDGYIKPTDKKILEILCPEISENVIVPMGGKNSVIDSARRLRESLPTNLPYTKIFALVDRDQNIAKEEEWIIRLPLCMIENFLLEPKAIYRLLEKYKENTPLKTLADIELALKKITDSLVEDEIRIRIKQKLGFVKGAFDGITIDEIKLHHKSMLDEIKQKLPSDEMLSEIIKEANSEVKGILQDHIELKLFRGKEILKRFYDEHVKTLTFSYFTFCVELAKEASKDNEHTKKLRELVIQINSGN